MPDFPGCQHGLKIPDFEFISPHPTTVWANLRRLVGERDKNRDRERENGFYVSNTKKSPNTHPFKPCLFLLLLIISKQKTHKSLILEVESHSHSTVKFYTLIFNRKGILSCVKMVIILKSVSEKDSSLDQTLVGLLNFLLGPSVHPHCKKSSFQQEPC